MDCSRTYLGSNSDSYLKYQQNSDNDSYTEQILGARGFIEPILFDYHILHRYYSYFKHEGNQG